MASHKVPTSSGDKPSPETCREAISLHALSPFVHLCGEFSMLPGFGRAPWFTPEHHFIHVVSGGGCYKVGEETHQLVAEDLLLIPPGVWTQSWNPTDAPMRYHSVHFDFQFHGDYETLPVTLREECAGTLMQIHPAPLTVPALRLPAKTNVADQSDVTILFNRLIREVAEKKPGYELASKAALLELLVILHRAASEAVTEKDHPIETVRQAVRFLEENFPRALTLKDIAAAGHLSPVYFGRLFRKVTGLTPMAYLRSLRMEQAKRLLFTEDLTVGQVAEQVGYADPYHFSRVFRKHAGISPSQYRTLARERQTPLPESLSFSSQVSFPGPRFFSIPPSSGS